MTAQDLIDAFETMADAPNGVEKLRELVLDLAVRGQLVDQYAEDGTASALLRGLRESKAQLVAGKSIRKPKPLPDLPDSETPYGLPSSWTWVRLGDPAILIVDGSHNPPKDVGPSGIPMLSGQNVRDGFITLDASRFVSALDFEAELKRYQVNEGDLLVCIVGSIGRSAVVPEDFPPVALQRSAALIRLPGINPAYLSFVFRSPVGQDYLLSNAKGTAQLGVYLGTLAQMPLPLPPLEEQHRIVAKVDELMSLLDRLEAARDSRDTTRASLRDAALQALQDAEDAEEVQAAWSRISENMDELFTDPADVEPLRQAVLQLAVRGRLVPQSSDDEPSESLLFKLQEEKAKLVQQGVIKKQKTLAPISDDECPICIPSGWAVARLGELLVGTSAGWSPKCESHPTRGDHEWGVLKTTAIQQNEFIEHHHKALPERLEPRPELEVRSGDLLVTRAGPWFRVGVAAHVEQCRRKLMLSDKIIRCEYLSSGLSGAWLALCINVGPGADYLRSKQTGMDQAQVNISQSRLKNAPIMIPPVEEQCRIMSKVIELIGECSRLKDSLEAVTRSGVDYATVAVEAIAS